MIQKLLLNSGVSATSIANRCINKHIAYSHNLLSQTLAVEWVALKSPVALGIECQLCHQSVCETAVLLDHLQSVVSAIIVKWKHRRTRAAQP